jgi:hypothetical protein
MKRRDTTRRLLVIAEIENPWFILVRADWIRLCPCRIALPLLLPAILDQFTDINRLIAANHDVIATRAERVA